MSLERNSGINGFAVEMKMHRWAMEPAALQAFMDALASLPATAALPAIDVAAPRRGLKVHNGTAVIAVSGVLLKTFPAWLRLWGIVGTGYDEIRAQLDEAMASKSVKAIELHVASPGGVVDGLADTADAIRAARQTKPVTAVVEDLAASAAYWLASQAQEIEANRTAEIGSIGVYTVYVDRSKADKKRGRKIIVIRSGEHKGMGVDGVTDEQVNAVQEIVDALNTQFVNAVAEGRGLPSERIRALATGRLWLADAAREYKLIDVVTRMEMNPLQDNQGGLAMDEKHDSLSAVGVMQSRRQPATRTFVQAAKALAQQTGMKLGDAFKKVACEQPELYDRHIAALGIVRPTRNNP